MAGLLGGVLPYLYSQGDRAKRQVNALLADPLGSLAQTAGLIQDQRREKNVLMDEAFADRKRPFNPTSQNALGEMIDRTMAGPMGFAPAGMTAWHGSPHLFDKFDSSKIGTGEGAQAYGHGLYLAESPEVAKGYQTTLASQNHAAIKQNGPNNYSVVAPDGSKVADGVLLGQAHRAKDGFDAAQTGALYKVDLPDNAVARMLDWDKPLSAQPKQIQDFFEPLVAPVRNVEAGSSGAGWGDLAAPRAYDPTGRDLLQLLNGNKEANAANVLSGGTGGAATSTKLRAAGIPGIRYLDNGSREAGGTSNFVVFPGEEGLLSILERNGQPLNALAPKPY